MDVAFVLPALLFLLCLVIRSVYELLKQSRRINAESKPIFIFVFVSMCVLWISWFYLCTADPFRMNMPEVARWAAFAIFIIGLVFAFGALMQLRGVENIDHLVTTGLFRRFRHPMYVGFISWIVGWSLFHGALPSLAIGIPGIVSILWWRHLEEGRLAVQFGKAYEDYRQKTWF